MSSAAGWRRPPEEVIAEVIRVEFHEHLASRDTAWEVAETVIEHLVQEGYMRPDRQVIGSPRRETTE